MWIVFVIYLRLQHQVSPSNILSPSKLQMFRENCLWQNFLVKDRLLIVCRQIQWLYSCSVIFHMVKVNCQFIQEGLPECIYLKGCCYYRQTRIKVSAPLFFKQFWTLCWDVFIFLLCFISEATCVPGILRPRTHHAFRLVFLGEFMIKVHVSYYNISWCCINPPPPHVSSDYFAHKGRLILLNCHKVCFCDVCG